MINLIKVFILSAALVSTSGYGVIVAGHGGSSCGVWTEVRSEVKTIRKYTYHAWLLGYLSGANTWGSLGQDIIENNDNAGLYGWMDNYCKENPLVMISDAVDELIQVLAK